MVPSMLEISYVDAEDFMSQETDLKTLAPVHVALTPQQRFSDFLQSRGMRNTEQRR
eukprot:COSAG01_NODE_47860_length_386_cov_0.898955_1_plen_55_part_10